jgi:quercetin dioxygenase-like cupin family protein
MRRAILCVAAMAALFCLPLFDSMALAQAPARNQPDPGVSPTRLMDRPEVRVTRVVVQPGATRSTHEHNDVLYHLFIPVSGQLELTIGSAAPVEAVPGQAYYMAKGTPHGFKNTGSTPAMIMEVFVKDAAPQTSTAGR